MGDLLYGIVVLVMLFFGLSLMANGWGLMSQREWQEEHEHHSDPELKKAVQESTHPEMQDIKEGEELMSVNFVEEDPPPIDKERFKLDSPALHGEGDPLYKSLQSRIDILREENKKDDDDDQDDGGSAVVARR